MTLLVSFSALADDWYVRGTFTTAEWDTSLKMSTTDNISYTYLLEDYVVESEKTYEFKIDDGNWGTSYPGSNYKVKIPAGTYDVFFYFNANTNDVKCIYNVELRSSTALLGTFERTGLGTYSLSLDLSSSLSDQYLKPVTYYGTSADWMGVGSFNGGSQLTDAENLLDVTTDVGDGKGYYYILKNSNKTYQTYTFNLTYDANGWSMSVAGDEAREHTPYTVYFVDGNNWGDDNVYAYTFGPEQSGAWHGTKMTRDGSETIEGTSYPKYTYTFEAYKPYPTNIIFNNNDAEQTGNLVLTNGHKYIHGVDMDPVYAVVGSSTALFGSNWDAATTTAYMSGPVDGKYTYTANNVALEAQDITLKVIKKAYTETETVDAWYPTANVTLNIPSSGTYDVTVTFDSEAANLWDQSTVIATATPHLNTYTATFDNAGKWAKVYAYVFNGTAIDGVVWPGKDITETLADGKYTYSAELSQQPAYIIFNAGNGGMQTTDLEFTNGNAYTYTVPNYRICGDGIFGGWGATEGDTDVNPMVLGDDGVFTWSKNDVEIGAGDLNHAFRIQINKKYHNDDDNAAITALYTGIDGIANNMAVNLTKTGIYDFTVTFNQNTKTVTCTPTRHPVAPKAYTVKVVNSGNWDNVHAYTWRGEEPSVVKGNGEWPGGEIAKSGEKAGNFDIYTYTTAILEEDDVPEKIIFNNGDDLGVEGSTKTANLTFEDNKTYWGVTTYGLEGAVFGGWKDGSTYRGIERLFTKAGENTYTYTEMGVALEAATTQYRVSVDGAWVDDYQNTSLEVATAGTYDITVTLNTSTKTTNVTLTPVLFSIDKALNLTDFEATAHSVDGSNISYAIGTVTPGTPVDGFTLTVTPTAPATSAAFTSALVADNNYWDNYFPSATLALAGEAMSGAVNFKNVTFTNVALVADQFIYYNNLKEVNLTYDAASSVTIPANCFASISSPHCAVTIDYTGSNFTVGENALEKTVAYTINVNGATAYDALLAYKTANSAAYTLNYTGTLYTATYVNTEDWTNVYAYAWQGTNTPVTAAWPGEQLTTTGTKVDGHDVYAFSNMHQPDHIIFHNNAGVQTADLAFVNEKQYSFVATDTYTVAGSSTQLFGAEWNYSEGSGNDMTKGEGTSTVYTKSYANVALSAGNIEYKVFKAYNNSTTFPAENAILNIATMGMYNVTFTFDASTNDVSAVVERQGDIPLTYSYVLAGDNDLVGADWVVDGSVNVMTENAGTYSLTLEDKTLEANNYGYKVVKLGKYNDKVYETTWIPDGMDNNKTVAIGEKGIYTITFTYDPTPGAANDGIAYSATPTQIEVPAISATGYATYSSAYALDFTDVTVFNAYIATGLDAQKQVVMAPAQQKVPAETGLVLAAEGGCEATLVPVAALAPAIGDNLLVAHVAAGDVAASAGSEYRYVLAKKGDKVGFYKLATTLNLPANRAYLQTTEALATNSTGKVSWIFDDDETTNINALTLGRSALNPTQPMYNISGQRVGNDYKGIVIQNGKKYVNK